MLSSDKRQQTPTAEQARVALWTITSNNWEGRWVDLPPETIEKFKTLQRDEFDVWQIGEKANLTGAFVGQLLRNPFKD